MASTLEDYEALLPWNVTPEQLNAPDNLGVVA